MGILGYGIGLFRDSGSEHGNRYLGFIVLPVSVEKDGGVKRRFQWKHAHSQS